MKTNGAPEKLYLFENPISNEPDDMWLSSKSSEEDIEYIRKDAFINKAAGWLSDNTLSGLCLDFGDAEIVREFVDNFRNYMKGE